MYSCLEHKEFRFLLPVLPLIMHICGCVLSGYYKQPSDSTDDCDNSDEDETIAETDNNVDQIHADSSSVDKSTTAAVSDSNVVMSSEAQKRWKWICVIGLIATNLPVALYTCLIHQRGVIDVTWYLHEHSATAHANTNMSVMFLMPCHSTPYYG